MALVWPSGKTHVVVYHYKGSIALGPRGKWIKKFPYRVVFIPANSDKTLAELIEYGIAIETPRTKCIALVKEYLLTAL